MGDELELKYSIDDIEAVVAFLDEQLPPARATAVVSTPATPTSTPTRALAKAGYGARLRRHGAVVRSA